MPTPRIKLLESDADRSKRYRDAKGGAVWLEEQRLKSKHYRDNMTEEQRKCNNETAKLRMRRMRQRKIAAAGLKETCQLSTSKGTTSKGKVATRSAAQKQEDMKAYKRNKQREYRAKMNPTKKRWVRIKDLEAKRKKAQMVKESEEHAGTCNTRAQRLQERTRLKDPEAYASHVESLIETATPRKRKQLEVKHILKKKARTEIVNTVKSVSKTTKGKGLVLDALRKIRSHVKRPLARLFGISKGSVFYKTKGRNTVKKVTDYVRKVVSDYYQSLEVSTQIPNKQRKKTGTNGPVFVLQNGIVETYNDFRLAHSTIKIGMITFLKLRPRNVRLMRAMKWMQCVCEICTNLETLLKAIRFSLTRHNFDVSECLASAKQLAHV